MIVWKEVVVGKNWRKELQSGERKVLGISDLLIILVAVRISWVYLYVKIHQSVHPEYVQFILCWLCLIKALPQPLNALKRS